MPLDQARRRRRPARRGPRRHRHPPLADWCLRGDDGGEPVATGSLLEVVETRPWGAAMAQELPDVQPLDTSPEAIMTAALELQAEGLWEFAS